MESQKLQTSPVLLANNGEPWLASRLLQRQVVNATSIDPVGRVADVVFDPESCQVTALLVQQPAPENRLMTAARRILRLDRARASITMDHIIALNGDVVMLDSDPTLAALTAPRGRMARLSDVCELTILTLHGICLGLLADVVLDDRGSGVVGYVIKPTKRAEPFLLPFEELGLSSQPDLESSVDAGAASPSSEPPATHLSFMPASPSVRIREPLILVLGEVEALRQDAVVIARQLEKRKEHVAQHNGLHPW